MRKIKFSFLPVTTRVLIIFTSVLFFVQCGNGLPYPGSSTANERVSANDIYSFSASGQVFSWKNAKQIDILIEDDASSDSYKHTLDAIDTWNGIIAEFGIKLNVINSGPSDIIIKWISPSALPTGVIGYATLEPGRSDNKVIYLSKEDRNSNFSKTLIIHELGHMLGLWSHSPDNNDIMYPFLSDNNRITSRDLATIKYLYGITPDRNLNSYPKNGATSAGISTPLNQSFRSISCALSINDLSFKITRLE